MQALSIALIVGSTRQGRFADKPTQWLMELGARRQDMKLEVLDLRDFPLPFFDEPVSPSVAPPKHPTAQAWAAQLARFDGFIFVTPEYNHGIPAVLKNALDYAFKEWHLKPAAFVGYGTVGAARAVQVLRQNVLPLRMSPVTRAVHVGAAELQGIRGGKAFSDFPQLEQAAGAMFDDLSWWASTLKPARERA